MSETILKYLYEDSTDVKTRITNHFSSEVKEFSFLTAKIIETLQHYHSLNPKYDSGDPKHIAYGLMTKGANTLMAGFELALSGYMWEPAVIFRSAIEGFATAWDVVHNKERFNAWNTSKKFESTKSISNASKANSNLGQIWGLLSNMHVHTCPLNSSPSILVSDQEPRFQFFGLIPPGKEVVQKGEIYSALFVAHICLELTELVFHNYSLGLETIEKIPGADYIKTKTSARHRLFVDAAIQYFTSIVKNPTARF